jgi:hypothetical protein
MKLALVGVGFIALSLAVAACGAGGGGGPKSSEILNIVVPPRSPAPSSSPSSTPTSPSPKPSHTATPRPSATPTPDPTETPTPHPTPTPRPTSTPTPGPYPSSISQTHVLTADYLGGYGGTDAFPWYVEAPYVSWAKASNPGDSNGQRAVGIKTYVYSDPNRTYAGGPLYTSDETTFAHTCGGARITEQYGSTTKYLMDPSSADMLALWVGSLPDRGNYDAVFEDNTDDLYGLNGTPCGYSSTGWLQSSVSETTNFGYPVVYNGAAFPGAMGMNDAPDVVGGMAEQCYATQNSAGRLTDSPWTAMENVEIAMARDRKLFFCLADARDDASSSIDDRTYNLASFLLTYDPGTTILMEFFSTSSGFHVEPESQLVALYPVVPMPSSVSSLQTASGVFAREYNACYLAGSLIGKCAVVVNPSQSSSHSFPYPGRYSRTLRLSGGGVLDGGTAGTNGAAPSSELPPLGSAVVFQ